MGSTRTHRALVRNGAALALASVPTETPPPGGLLVAPSFVGVCGTDLQILNGSRPDTADILGHEAAGVVVQAGKGAALHSGDRVVFNPSAQLTRGRILGHNVRGLFQQYFALDSQALEDGLVQPVEAGLPAICGALVEPVAGVIYTYQLITNVVPQPRSVVVFGAGPIGLICTEYFSEQGTRVLLVHSRQARLSTAVELNLVAASSAMVLSDDMPQRILEWNGGRPVDAAVICTSMAGAAVALAHAVRAVRSGACIEMVTNFPQSATTPPGIAAESLKTIRAANICGIPQEGAYIHAEVQGRHIAFASHRGTSRAHMTQAMRTLRRNAQRYTALITHVLSIEEAAEAIEKLAGSRSATIDGRDCIKAVVDLTRTATTSENATS